MKGEPSSLWLPWREGETGETNALHPYSTRSHLVNQAAEELHADNGEKVVDRHHHGRKGQNGGSQREDGPDDQLEANGRGVSGQTGSVQHHERTA